MYSIYIQNKIYNAIAVTTTTIRVIKQEVGTKKVDKQLLLIYIVRL